MTFIDFDALTDQQFDAEIAKSQRIADLIVEDIHDRSDEERVDLGSIIFSTWLSLIHHLTEIGWTEEELVKERFARTLAFKRCPKREMPDGL